MNHIVLVARIGILTVLLTSIAGCPSEKPSATERKANTESATQKTSSSSLPKADSTVPPVDQPKDSGVKFVPPELSEEQLREGWISLFDGSTLFGWESSTEANWRVEKGAIVVDAGEVSLLTTPFVFDDFELKCDFHLEEGGNSGIFLRTSQDPKNPATDTYELNICDSHPSHPTGSLVGRHVAQDVPKVEGEWHTFHVVCDGPQIQVDLDGTRIVDFRDESDSRRSAGTIGLQLNSGRAAFRNVFLKPLQSVELFNGSDLAGFREVPGSSGTFSVKENFLHAESGPGFLETEDTFQDFILHVEARIDDTRAIADGRPANSGVFFRALQGTSDAPSHGYEMQIQHDFRNNDRSKPLDFGSGGIYRRMPARYVVADNNEWFTETLIAQGNRFATWVNGYQVLDWIDDRKPDPNPRKGLRLDGGHFSLQGHDPTTSLDFRSLRVRNLPSRKGD